MNLLAIFLDGDTEDVIEELEENETCRAGVAFTTDGWQSRRTVEAFPVRAAAARGTALSAVETQSYKVIG